jgi:hypothetical protein
MVLWIVAWLSLPPIFYAISLTYPPSTWSSIGELKISRPPALNETANLTYTISSALNRLASARIVLPEGFIWVDCPENAWIWENRWLIKKVELNASEDVEISGTVKAIKTGQWTCEAFITDAEPEPPPQMTMKNLENASYEAGDLLTITVFKDHARVEAFEDWAGAPAPVSPLKVSLEISGEPTIGRVVSLQVIALTTFFE